MQVRDHFSGRGRSPTLLLALLLAAACAPPDRPPRLPDPLPSATEALLQPDSVQVRRLAPGVWYRYLWSGRGPWAVHLVQADLGRCELGLDVVRAPREAGKAGGHAPVTLLEAQVDSVRGGVLVAVNGDFFTPEGTPLGPELAEGDLRTARSRPALSWRPGGGIWIGSARVEGDTLLRVGWGIPLSPSRERGAGEVIGGYPEILDRGARVGDLLMEESPGFAGSRHPRTAVAWDPTTRRLWLVVVDGRQGGYSLGMTLPELAELLESLGVREALNLDGGGSTVMVVRGRRVSRPSDDAGERPVVNALLLRRDSAAWCGRMLRTDLPPPA